MVCAQELSNTCEDDSFKHPKIIFPLKIYDHSTILLSDKLVVYCYYQKPCMPAVALWKDSTEVFEP